jgi:hypothetical protein
MAQGQAILVISVICFQIGTTLLFTTTGGSMAQGQATLAVVVMTSLKL